MFLHVHAHIRVRETICSATRSPNMSHNTVGHQQVMTANPVLSLFNDLDI